ncbi:unnamed protein product [Pedinophyceae sp. YPF-701]|nr:unnamed protein product [Pedinophyceae sp. YPF-701]
MVDAPRAAKRARTAHRAPAADAKAPAPAPTRPQQTAPRHPGKPLASDGSPQRVRPPLEARRRSQPTAKDSAASPLRSTPRAVATGTADFAPTPATATASLARGVPGLPADTPPTAALAEAQVALALRSPLRDAADAVGMFSAWTHSTPPPLMHHRARGGVGDTPHAPGTSLGVMSPYGALMGLGSPVPGDAVQLRLASPLGTFPSQGERGQHGNSSPSPLRGLLGPGRARAAINDAVVYHMLDGHSNNRLGPSLLAAGAPAGAAAAPPTGVAAGGAAAGAGVWALNAGRSPRGTAVGGARGALPASPSGHRSNSLVAHSSLADSYAPNGPWTDPIMLGRAAAPPVASAEAAAALASANAVAAALHSNALHADVPPGPATPEEVCMMQVLARMGVSDQVAASGVCRTWRRAAQRLWAGTEQVAVEWSRSEREAIRDVLPKLHALRELTVHAAEDMSDADVSLLALSLPPRIQRVAFQPAPERPNALSGLSQAGLHHLSSANPVLRELCVEGASGLKELSIVGACLKSLRVGGCSALEKVQLRCPALVRLSIAALGPELPPVTPPPGWVPWSSGRLPTSGQSSKFIGVVRAIAEQCPNLECLHIASEHITDMAVHTLLSNQPGSLRALALNHAPTLTSSGIGCIPRRCPQLALLDVSGCWSLTDSAIEAACAPLAGTLTALHAAACPRLSRAGVQRLLTRLPKLTTLDVGYSLSRDTEEGVVQGADVDADVGVAARLPRATRRLDFAHVGGSPAASPVVRARVAAADAAEFGEGDGVDLSQPASEGTAPVYELVAESQSLTTLSLWGCTRLERLLLRCPSLQRLVVTRCAQLDIDEVVASVPAGCTVVSERCG